MGKLGKKARKFSKKNLQSVERRNRKFKSTFKKRGPKSKLLISASHIYYKIYVGIVTELG